MTTTEAVLTGVASVAAYCTFGMLWDIRNALRGILYRLDRDSPNRPESVSHEA